MPFLCAKMAQIIEVYLLSGYFSRFFVSVIERVKSKQLAVVERKSATPFAAGSIPKQWAWAVHKQLLMTNCLLPTFPEQEQEGIHGKRIHFSQTFFRIDYRRSTGRSGPHCDRLVFTPDLIRFPIGTGTRQRPGSECPH
jgi:hypothetical protein